MQEYGAGACLPIRELWLSERSQPAISRRPLPRKLHHLPAGCNPATAAVPLVTARIHSLLSVAQVVICNGGQHADVALVKHAIHAPGMALHWPMSSQGGGPAGAKAWGWQLTSVRQVAQKEHQVSAAAAQAVQRGGGVGRHACVQNNGGKASLNARVWA